MSISIPAPHLELLCQAIVQIAAPQIIGERRVIPINGGAIAGPHLKGVILPGGADWQIVRADGSVRLEARYTVQTDDGALVFVRHDGIHTGAPEILARLDSGEAIDPRSYYLRATAYFEGSAPKYAWLGNLIALGSGALTRETLVMDFYSVR